MVFQTKQAFQDEDRFGAEEVLKSVLFGVAAGMGFGFLMLFIIMLRLGLV